jgi:hypothetical protein
VTVIPFPSSRFTKEDVASIVEFCCHLVLLGTAGGWARHTADSGADILRILDAEDDLPLYTFDRTGGGRYRVWNRHDRLIAEGRSLPDLMAHWALAPERPPIAANGNRP